jgi:hypothetical protein
MMLRAPETEALDEGYAQKGFGFLSLDGSPVPLGSTATNEPIEIHRSLWGRWSSLDDHRIKTLWIKKQSNPKQKNISDNQQPSGDKRLRISAFPEHFIRLSFLGVYADLFSRLQDFILLIVIPFRRIIGSPHLFGATSVI